MPARTISIRTLVTLIVVIPIAIASGLLVWLSASTSRRVAEELGRSLVETATDRAAAEVRAFLSEAVRVSDLYARRIDDGLLPTADLRRWERAMLDDLVTSPRVASICFGNAEGDATWLLRGEGRLELGRVTGGRNDEAVELAISPRGEVGDELLRDLYRFDPRERPWYPAALANESPVWTPVYFWFGQQGGAASTGTGYTRAMRRDGQVVGVLVIDVTLGGLSEYLKSLPLAEQGHVFIVDGSDMLVAASEGAVTTPTGERLRISESGSPALVAAVEAIRGTGGGNSRDMRRIVVDGEPARAMVVAMAPYPGIEWRVISILPERAFLGQTKAVMQRASLLAFAAVLANLVLGVWLSGALIRPLRALSDHVHRVGSGDFESRLSLNGARELVKLSDDLNQMAEDLKHRDELQKAMAVVVEVQRSLLPAADPRLPTLDVAGRSRYCDAAGGDYYDFVDVAPLGGRSAFFAVGDVMGHGIAAALLMASARAALRAGAAEGADLARLLTRVNTVLAKDARHNQFMTMALVVVEPETRTVRWASAGHDPTIVYHPADDRFEELEGGGLLMGIMEDVEYEEYSRRCLSPGDVLLIGTDGIWEMPNSQNQQYGKDRLREVVRRNHMKPAAEIAAALEADLAAYRGTVAQKDDVTFVVAKVL